MLSNSIQWLVGLVILVVGVLILFSQIEEASLSGLLVDTITVEDFPQTPADLPVQPVDAKTQACMADVVCMQDFLLKITLGNDYEPSNRAKPAIQKWQDSIKYRIYGWDRLDAERMEALKQGLADMREIMDLVGLSLIPSNRKINVVVLLTEDLEADLEGRFSELADQAFRPIPGFVDQLISLREASTVCGATVGAKPDDSLGYVGMFLSLTIDDQLLKRCVYEEFSQMLGLYSDVADDIDSLYTDQVHRMQLTEFDLFLLRLLYHPSITSGMDRNDVVAVFPDVYKHTVEMSARR